MDFKFILSWGLLVNNNLADFFFTKSVYKRLSGGYNTPSHFQVSYLTSTSYSKHKNLQGPVKMLLQIKISFPDYKLITSSQLGSNCFKIISINN